MPSKTFLVGIVVAMIFIAGAGYIVYMGRPAAKLSRSAAVSTEPTVTPSPSPSPTPAPTETGSPTPSVGGSYTMADVQAHATEADCWSAISGNVYDLTTWVSRHPGGAEKIVRLCGTDGTAAFTKKHDGAERPTAMLVLLKIGSLE